MLERADRIKMYKTVAAQVQNSNGDLSDALSPAEMAEYEEAFVVEEEA